MRARSTPPQFAKDYNEELLSYFRDNHKREKGLHSRKFVKLGAEDTGRHATQIAARFYSFVYIDENGDEVHYCPDPKCCRGFGSDVTIKESKKLHRQFMFPAIPERPEQGKWTKLGLCFDWHVHARSGNFLRKAWEPAFRNIQIKYDLEAANKQTDKAKDAEITGTIDWQSSASSRGKRAAASVKDRTHDFDILALAIVLEGQRFLTGIFLQFS